MVLAFPSGMATHLRVDEWVAQTALQGKKTQTWVGRTSSWIWRNERKDESNLKNIALNSQRTSNTKKT